MKEMPQKYRDLAAEIREDASYLHGLVAGWNLGLREDAEAMETLKASRHKQVVEGRNELRKML